MKKIIMILLTLLMGFNGVMLARGGGGGHGGGGFGGGHGFGGGGFHGGGFGGRGFGGGHYFGGGNIGRSSSFAGHNFGRSSYVGTGYTGGSYGRSAYAGRTTGYSHANAAHGTGYNRASTVHVSNAGHTAHVGQAGKAGQHTAAHAGQNHFNQANKSAGLNRQNVSNKQHLAQSQASAKQRIGQNSKLSGMNRQSARNAVGRHGWNHWHRGPNGWNNGWWGLGWGLWPLGIWGWGWNWAWMNGIWWWGGFPWWWWNDYDPAYFEEVVYPAYVANYQDVSGDQSPNYWDITNQTDDAVTVNAQSGDKNAIIQVGQTKRVFHTPGDNQFTIITANGNETQQTQTNTKVTIKNAPEASDDTDAMELEE